MKLRPYSEYKDSGVPWLGTVPVHWQIKPNRALFQEIREANYPDEEMLSVTITKGVILQSELLSETSKKDSSNVDKSKYKRVCPGDLVYNKMRAWQGAIGLSHYRGIVSPAYIVERPREEIVAEYAHYLFRTPRFAKEAERWSYGITSDQWSLRPEHFKAIYTCVPPKNEQTQIARFLDWKTAQIDRVIRAKRQLIERLKEQKQVLINQAVTGAIDVRTGKPHPEYKDSGVPWLGKVPAGWEVLPIKRVVRFNPSKSETGDSPSVNKQLCFLPMERISEEGEIDCSEKRQLSEVWEGFTYFRRGDVVLAKITPCFENGKGAYLSELETEYGFGTTELFVLRPTQKIHGDFLRFVTATKTFRWLGAQNMTGAAGQQRVPSSFVKNFQIGLPPLDEQEAIVSFIQRISNSIGTAITRTQREIDLIQECRTRLIADVVTGKLDVRGVEVPDFDKRAAGDTDTKESEIPACDQEVVA